jgi:thiol-disulfide isomerase/thioredoxin
MKKKLICLNFTTSHLIALGACASGEPEKPEKPESVESGISFETTDLAGNTVRSEDIFGENALTMVNLWGTYCGPCIGEMPDLEELNGRLKDKKLRRRGRGYRRAECGTKPW